MLILFMAIWGASPSPIGGAAKLLFRAAEYLS